MAKWDKFPESKNFEDRTWQSAIYERLNELWTLLNEPNDSEKSFISPADQQYRHKRPIHPLDRNEVTGILTDDPYPNNSPPDINNPYNQMLIDYYTKRRRKSYGAIPE